MIDIASLSFLGLIGIGVSNVVSFFRPSLDSRMKFGICFAAVFVATFIPYDLANEFLNKAKLALEVAFAGSGAYKLAQKAGGI
jgi:hypothetical protein